MALAKRVTKKDIVAAVNDEKKLDRLVDAYFKQDSYRLEKGKPKLSLHTVTTAHRCTLCKSKWELKSRIPTNMEIDPDVLLRHETCHLCPSALLHRSKVELAQMLITLTKTGRFAAEGKRADPSDYGPRINRNITSLEGEKKGDN